MTTDETIQKLRQRVGELTEENARLAEQVAARDNFLAFAAHELRNPMTPIINRITMLRKAISEGRLPPEELPKKLEQIDEAMALFMKRATTLLDISRFTSGHLRLEQQDVEVCAVARRVAATFEPHARYAGSPMSLDLPPRGISVLGDRLAIEEVLDNLVSNAIKYGNGKPIHISAVADAANGEAHVSVEDGGPGIPAESQGRIFERFERAVQRDDRAGGFGVGLWVVKQLVDAMKGTISVKSTPGVGSTFRVTLPLRPVRSPNDHERA